MSKTKPAEALREAYAAGLRDFGENYLQEALGKQLELADRLRHELWNIENEPNVSNLFAATLV